MSYAHKGSILPVRNVIIPVTYDTHLFNFDYHARSGRGLEPEPGSVYTLTPDGRFSGAIAVEESTQNVVTTNGENSNPFSSDDSGVSHELSTDFVKFGERSIKWTKSDGGNGNTYLHGGDLNVGVYSTEWTFSCYIRRSDGLPINNLSPMYMYIYSQSTGSRIHHSDYPTTIEKCNDGWYRVSISKVVGEMSYVGLVGFSSLSSETDWYMDGWQVEPKPFPTSYVEEPRDTGQMVYNPGISPEEGTVMVWWKPRTILDTRQSGQLQNPQIFHLGDYYGNSSFVIWCFNGSIKAYIKTTEAGWDKSFSVGSGVQPNNWYHIAVTWKDYKDFKVYMDGNYRAGVITTNPMGQWSGGNQFRIYHNAAAHPNAIYDDLAFMPYAASPEEIRAIYESQAPLYDPYDYSIITA